MAIEQEIVTVTTTGSAGSASGAGATPGMSGFLLDIYLDYTGQPATTDVTIAYDEPDSGNILVVSNNATDGLYAPRKQVCDAAGAAVAGAYDLLPLNGKLSIAVDQGDDAGTVKARIRYLSE